MKLYGVRHIKTKNPLRISIFSNEGGDFCNDCGARFETSDYNDVIYMVTDEDVATKALSENPEWYNASLERPEWPDKFNPLDYEVFTVSMKH